MVIFYGGFFVVGVFYLYEDVGVGVVEAVVFGVECGDEGVIF